MTKVDKKELKKMLQELKRDIEEGKNVAITNLNLDDEVFQGEVKKWGSSAHVPTPKKYLGRKATVIIRKKGEDDNKD